MADPTTPAPLAADLLERVLVVHTPSTTTRHPNDRPHCVHCDQWWPCIAASLMASVNAERAARERAEADVRRYAGDICRLTREIEALSAVASEARERLIQAERERDALAREVGALRGERDAATLRERMIRDRIRFAVDELDDLGIWASENLTDAKGREFSGRLVGTLTRVSAALAGGRPDAGGEG